MAEQITLFDVSTGEYVTKDKNPDLDWSINGDQWKYGTMPDGSTVRIDTTVENWRDYGGMKTYEDGGEWTFGYQAPDAPAPPPSWDDGLQGNLGEQQDPPTILQPTPPPPAVEDPFTPPPTGGTPIDDPWTPPDGGYKGPTDDWFATDPPGYENAPQPDGDGSFVEGGPPADTSWDWNFFRDKAPGDRQWGGYDEDYQAFERYQPGMDSPWGMPNIEGGNEDFYQQQFVNQLRDEQGFRNRQRSSAMRAQEAADNPYEAPTSDEMWSWANGGKGLPEVRLGTGETTPTSYNLNSQYEGMSNRQAWDAVKGKDAFADRDLQKYMDNYFNRQGNEGISGGNQFLAGGDPNAIFSNINSDTWQGMNHSGQVQSGLNQFINNLYTPSSQGPTAPVGYASPIGWGGAYGQ